MYLHRSSYNISSLQLKDTPWPRFHHDNKCTGKSPYPSYSDGTLKWSLPLGGVRSSPAIDLDGTIYISSYSNSDYMGHIYAINPDGTQKWTTNPTININTDYSSIAISSDGTLYIGAADGNLYAIDSSNGSILWTYSTIYPATYSSPSIGSDGTIYIVSDIDSILYAINPNGTEKWNYPKIGNNGNSPGSPVIASDGTIIFSTKTLTPNGVVTAVNPNGTLKWEYNLIGDIDYASPSIGPNDVTYIGDALGNFYGIDINGNAILNVNNFSNSITSAPAFSQDNSTIYIGAGYNYTAYDYIGAGLYALNINTGGMIWYFATPNQVRSSPAIDTNGIIYFGNDNSPTPYFYAVKPDGNLKWSVSLVDKIRSSPAIAPDGTIYVGDRYNTFYAFESLSNCPISPKYSGDTITMKATPKDGIGPYYVVFRKDGSTINPLRLVDEFGTPSPDNPILSATEDVEITRVYTLDDVDVATSGGTIDFSVYISDSCPTGAQTCTDTCTINIGCVAPVCNFVVT